MAVAKKPIKRFSYELNAEDKARFLQLIREGHRPDFAAELLDTTGSQFRRLRNPQSEHYDAKFAQGYEEAMVSPERDQGRVNLLRDVTWSAAMKGERWALEKLNLIYDPDWETLRHQNFRHEVDVLIRRLPELGLSREQIDRAIEAEQGRLGTPQELKALPAPADVDAA